MNVTDYIEYFNMKNIPFSNKIEVPYLYQSKGITGNLNKLKLCVQENSFALLTGDPGTGKSTFLRQFTASLPSDEYLVLYVSMSNVTPRWIYTVPLEILGIKPHIYVNDARRQFHNELEIQKNTYKKKVVMIIDEAHLLIQNYRRYDILEEIRFLLNGTKYDSGSPLALILSGQTELLDTLSLSKCAAIRQRIVYACRTCKLSEEEVGPYIASHLRYAGVSELLFSSEAIDFIAKISGGIPRIINKICTHSLNYAAIQNEKIVTEELATKAANNEVIDIILKDGFNEKAS